MSNLLYDARIHEMTLWNRYNQKIGSWQAHNLVDSHSTLAFLENGTYPFLDISIPHRHGSPDDTDDGKFGPYGIFRIVYPGHQGIGVHSGRRLHTPNGPAYWTNGCVRTTDAAMKAIFDTAKDDPLTTLTIIGNHKETRDDAARWLHDHPVP